MKVSVEDMNKVRMSSNLLNNGKLYVWFNFNGTDEDSHIHMCHLCNVQGEG